MKKMKWLSLALVPLMLALALTACPDGGSKELPKVTVTFDLNNPLATSAPPAPQTINEGQRATKPVPDPEITGFKFGGWYKEAACINEWDFLMTVSKDTKLYAKWDSVTKVGLTILQVYGCGVGGGEGVNRSFVELYNNTAAAINLTGYTLWYGQGGSRGSSEPDGPWEKIDLSGTIPKDGSYLIIGDVKGTNSGRLKLADSDGDMNKSGFVLGNRSLKVALINGSFALTQAMVNPYDVDGAGTPATGLIDFVGARNTQGEDPLEGYRVAAARNSGSEGIRRASFWETGNNSIDFPSIRYALGGATSISDEVLEVRRPRKSSVGAWDPFAEPSLAVTNLSHDPMGPNETNAVTITATVAPLTAIKSVALEWKLNGTAQADLTMTAEGTTYTGTIPAQAVAAVVEYSVAATGNDSAVKRATGTYTVKDSAAAVDYTKLALNEVNGFDKWFEIYNTGDVAISLTGVKAYYNSGTSYALTWTGLAADTIAPKGFFVIGTTAVADEFKNGLMTTGLSANNVNVKLQLRDPSDTALDTYEKPAGFEPTATDYLPLRDKAHARLPDGTGDWYYLDNSFGTRGRANGTAAAPEMVKFGMEAAAGFTAAKPYFSVVINEVNGVAKWFELYNNSGTAVSLDGVKAYYNNGIGWTGVAGDSIPANGYFIIGTSAVPAVDRNGLLSTGLSANNINVKLQIRAPNGTAIDTYMKPIDVNTNAGASPGNYPNLVDRAHARIPNGTGPWYYTADGTGTRAATNGTVITGLTKFGFEKP